MHGLGVTLAVVGFGVALIAEGLALLGTFQGRWQLSEFTQRGTFRRWFFTGLVLGLVGLVVVAT